ncbi:hypothetical protein SDC9_102224 [bioreactor metagenome]|uniref:Uncharacterized protein n=1 Tax=bioreactor metagenome TaxID=1076179 RepID=A0A645AQU5_9ZZZZ
MYANINVFVIVPMASCPMLSPDLSIVLKLFSTIFSESSFSAEAIDMETSITAPREPITMLLHNTAMRSIGFSVSSMSKNMVSSSVIPVRFKILLMKYARIPAIISPPRFPTMAHNVFLSAPFISNKLMNIMKMLTIIDDK